MHAQASPQAPLRSTSDCAHAVQVVAEAQNVQFAGHALQTPLLLKVPAGQSVTASFGMVVGPRTL